MAPLHCHCTSYMLVMCVHSILISTLTYPAVLCIISYIRLSIHIRRAGTHRRIPAEMRGRGTKGERLGRYANDKYPDRWMVVKNVNLDPTVNSTAPDPPDGNRVHQMETKGNTAWVTHPTSMTHTWPWPHEHKTLRHIAPEG